MTPKKQNARGVAGVSVAGRQAETTKQTLQRKSTISASILKSKSTESAVQRKKILALLRRGAKTTIDLRTHGILMPATRIFELKKAGHSIQTELVSLFDAHGFSHQRCARYRLLSKAVPGGDA